MTMVIVDHYNTVDHSNTPLAFYHHYPRLCVSLRVWKSYGASRLDFHWEITVFGTSCRVSLLFRLSSIIIMRARAQYNIKEERAIQVFDQTKTKFFVECLKKEGILPPQAAAGFDVSWRKVFKKIAQFVTLDTRKQKEEHEIERA